MIDIYKLEATCNLSAGTAYVELAPNEAALLRRVFTLLSDAGDDYAPALAIQEVESL